jgi:hypothetical protein
VLLLLTKCQKKDHETGHSPYGKRLRLLLP